MTSKRCATTLLDMRIQFCGADRTVTGSCHLLEIGGKRILLDMGLYQGRRDVARLMNENLIFNPRSIDAVILSHGHLDHCGRLPVLMRKGFSGSIYCTPATAEVARVVLQDAGRIQEENTEYLNRRTRPSDEPVVEPLYRYSDVGPVLKSFRPTRYGERTEISPGIWFSFFDAGHILGSAYVVIEWSEGGKPRRLLFTADLGRYGTPIIRDPHPLSGVFDFIITESTYGNKRHGAMNEVEPQLLDAVQHAIQHRGRLIIPSFAVGRTQTILWYMQKFIREKRMPAIPIYVDSPMGVEISQITREFRQEYDQETLSMIEQGDLFAAPNITLASSRDQSKQINRDRGPCVIIASSPTCEFGRVLHHVVQSVENRNDMILFVGWTPPETLGRRLQDGQQRVRILDRYFDVRCEIRTIHGLSAHADGDELLRFLSPTLNRQTTAYVVHGEAPQAEGFAARLLREGIGAVMVPAIETSAMSGEISAPPPTPDRTTVPTHAEARVGAE